MELMSKPTKRYGTTTFIDPYKRKQLSERLSESLEIGCITHTHTAMAPLWLRNSNIINSTYRFCSESKLVLILHGWLTLFVLFSGLILFKFIFFFFCLTECPPRGI